MINPFDIVRRGLQVEYFARTESTNKLAREDLVCGLLIFRVLVVDSVEIVGIA